VSPDVLTLASIARDQGSVQLRKLDSHVHRDLDMKKAAVVSERCWESLKASHSEPGVDAKRLWL